MLINCPDCGKEVSDAAPVCPNCGCPVRAAVTTEKVKKAVSAGATAAKNTAKRYVGATALLIVAVLLGLLAYALHIKTWETPPAEYYKKYFSRLVDEAQVTPYDQWPPEKIMDPEKILEVGAQATPYDPWAPENIVEPKESLEVARRLAQLKSSPYGTDPRDYFGGLSTTAQKALMWKYIEFCQKEIALVHELDILHAGLRHWQDFGNARLRRYMKQLADEHGFDTSDINIDRLRTLGRDTMSSYNWQRTQGGTVVFAALAVPFFCLSIVGYVKASRTAA